MLSKLAAASADEFESRVDEISQTSESGEIPNSIKCIVIPSEYTSALYTSNLVLTFKSATSGAIKLCASSASRLAYRRRVEVSHVNVHDFEVEVRFEDDVLKLDAHVNHSAFVHESNYSWQLSDVEPVNRFVKTASPTDVALQRSIASN